MTERTASCSCGQLTASASGDPIRVYGGGRVHFSFCPTCAATVHFYLEGHEASIAIPVGAFADRSFPPPVFSMYEERKHDWVEVPADAEHNP